MPIKLYTCAGLPRCEADASRVLLREGEPAPGGRWANLAILESVRYYKARHASTLLVFEAVEEAIAAVERDRAAA